MVRPYNMREPHGKIRHVDHLLHFAVPSDLILPNSSDTRVPNASLCSQRLPDQTNDLPRLGAGTWRHESCRSQPIDEAL